MWITCLHILQNMSNSRNTPEEPYQYRARKVPQYGSITTQDFNDLSAATSWARQNSKNGASVYIYDELGNIIQKYGDFQ